MVISPDKGLFIALIGYRQRLFIDTGQVCLVAMSKKLLICSLNNEQKASSRGLGSFNANTQYSDLWVVGCFIAVLTSVQRWCIL